MYTGCRGGGGCAPQRPEISVFLKQNRKIWGILLFVQKVDKGDEKNSSSTSYTGLTDPIVRFMRTSFGAGMITGHLPWLNIGGDMPPVPPDLPSSGPRPCQVKLCNLSEGVLSVRLRHSSGPVRWSSLTRCPLKLWTYMGALWGYISSQF